MNLIGFNEMYSNNLLSSFTNTGSLINPGIILGALIITVILVVILVVLLFKSIKNIKDLTKNSKEKFNKIVLENDGIDDRSIEDSLISDRDIDDDGCDYRCIEDSPLNDKDIENDDTDDGFDEDSTDDNNALSSSEIGRASCRERV